LLVIVELLFHSYNGFLEHEVFRLLFYEVILHDLFEMEDILRILTYDVVYLLVVVMV